MSSFVGHDTFHLHSSKPCLHLGEMQLLSSHCVFWPLTIYDLTGFSENNPSSVFLVPTVCKHWGKSLLMSPQTTWEQGRVYHPYFTEEETGAQEVKSLPQERLGSEPRLWERSCAFDTGWTASDLGMISATA